MLVNLGEGHFWGGPNLRKANISNDLVPSFSHSLILRKVCTPVSFFLPYSVFLHLFSDTDKLLDYNYKKDTKTKKLMLRRPKGNYKAYVD